MKKYVKVNHNTWVKTNNPEAWLKRANEGSYRPQQEKGTKPNVSHNYASFVSDAFEEVKYLSQSNLHNLIKKTFGSNVTYYRKMMLKLELITERNNLYKLNTIENES